MRLRGTTSGEDRARGIGPATGAVNAHRRGPRRRWLLGAALGVTLAVGAGAFYDYHRFYHHLTSQEVAHVVEHSTFAVSLRDGRPVEMQLYQQTGARPQPLVLFTSGDGGWSPFCAETAAHIAATGRTVVGFDAKTYLTTFANAQRPVTPEELARDYDSLISAALARPGVDAHAPVTLSGWSLGAGFSVLAATSPDIKARLGKIVAISLPALNELAWKPTDALIYLTHGTPHEKVFQAGECVGRLAPIPLIMLNATDDDTAPLADAQRLFALSSAPKKLSLVRASGHHFEGGEEAFYRALDEGLAYSSVDRADATPSKSSPHAL